jgi:hypothetical protein
MAVSHRIAIALVAVVAAAIPSAAQSPSEQLILDWLALVRAHEPGTMDDASTSTSEWSPDQVELLLPHALAGTDVPTLIRALSMHTDIAVKVKGGGEVRARLGYWAGSTADAK